MEFLKALQDIKSKHHRKQGIRAYYNNGEVYLSRLFGYNRVSGRYVPDPRYSPAIEKIFQMLANGYMLPEVKKELDVIGAKDSSNNRFSIARIIAIAERPIYTGCLIQRGRFIEIKNIKPIVEREVYERAIKQLQKEKKKIIR
jgi:hypothetical protein